MSNFQPSKSDPLWFLDNHEDKKETLNAETDNVDTKRSSDDEIFDLNYLKESDAKLLEQINQSGTNDSNSINKNDSTSENAVQEKTVPDTITLKSELENSIFDLARKSFQNGKKPEFRITISSNDDKQSSDNTRIINIDRFLQSNNIKENEQSEKVDADVNSEVNEKLVEDSSIDQLITESLNDKAAQDTKPKVRLVIKTNINNNNDNIADLVSDSDEEICSEIGSSIINLNDYVSPGAQPLTGTENISTSVNFPNNDDAQNRKVELVITIKDERKKPVDEAITENSYTNEMKVDFPSLDGFLNESLEDKLADVSKRLQKLASRYSSHNERLQTSKSSRVESQDKWSTETKNYVREDGARCHRTVTVTPQGRRVQIQCYNGDRRRARRNYGWPLGAGSIWGNMDDDINHVFRANRLMFF